MGDETLHLEQYTPGARRMLSRAQVQADEAKHLAVTPLHVFSVLLLTHPWVFERAGADPAGVLAWTEAELARLKVGDEPSTLDASCLAVLSRAERDAVSRKAEVGVDHVARALFEVRPDLASAAGGGVKGEDFLAPSPRPTEPGAPAPSSTSDLVYVYEGRRKLRKIAAERGLSEDDGMATERAARLMTGLRAELQFGVAVLSLDGDPPHPLVVTRPGRPGELRIEWRPRTKMLAVKFVAGPGAPTELTSYQWVAAEGRWTRSDRSGDFFDDLVARIDGAFYAPLDPAPPVD